LKKLEKEIHSAARQSGTERVETREEFELDKSRFMQQQTMADIGAPRKNKVKLTVDPQRVRL
jgi:hypothetical protein